MQTIIALYYGNNMIILAGITTARATIHLIASSLLNMTYEHRIVHNCARVQKYQMLKIIISKFDLISQNV